MDSCSRKVSNQGERWASARRSADACNQASASWDKVLLETSEVSLLAGLSWDFSSLDLYLVTC